MNQPTHLGETRSVEKYRNKGVSNIIRKDMIIDRKEFGHELTQKKKSS